VLGRTKIRMTPIITIGTWKTDIAKEVALAYVGTLSVPLR